MNLKITNQDKVNHYVNNLAQYIQLWDDSFLELHINVQEVKETQAFKQFCIEKHDAWKITVNTLNLFFK